MDFLYEKLAALGVGLGLNVTVLCLLIHALATEKQMRTQTTGFLINYFATESIYLLQGIAFIVTESERYVHACDLLVKLMGLLFLKLVVFNRDLGTCTFFQLIAFLWIKYSIIKVIFNYNPHIAFAITYFITLSMVLVMMTTNRFPVNKHKLYFICVYLMVSIGNLLYALDLRSDFIVSFNFLQILTPVYFFIFWYFGDAIFQEHFQSLCRKPKQEDEIDFCCDDDNASINITFSKSNANV